MADNIDVDPGTGGSKQPVATDDCGASGHFQRVKLDGGADGVSTPFVAGQQTMAASFPVVLASNQTTIPATAVGTIAHNDAAGSVAPLLIGGYAAAGSPTNVSTTNDAVRAWFLLNGSQVCSLAAGTNLIGGDTTNGLDVDVTRVIPGTSATHLGKAIDSAVGATDTGVAALVVRDDALTTLTPADNDFTVMRTDSTGALWTRETAPSAGGPNSVAASASNVTLLAANAARRGATIMNDSTAILYVKFGATASTTSFHVKMAAGSYLEVPFGYTGIIDGIWASATGDARVGEFT